MIDHFIQALPLVALIAAACAFLGWSMHGVANKPAAAKTAKPSPASDKAERAKNLENALDASKATNKSLKAELETLRNSTVSKETFDATTAELDAARQQQDATDKRIAALEVELKKAQDTIRAWNARTNDADKAQKSRTFALENELSKAREQLALLNERPDDNAALHAEIERLRESVATTTRFTGELRKREAAALAALEKAEARVAQLAGGDRPAAGSRKLGPVASVGDSDRTAAAKAEVLRLVEMNRRAQAVAEETPPAEIEKSEPPVEMEAAPATEQPPPAPANDPTGEVTPPESQSDTETPPAGPATTPAEAETPAKRPESDMLSYD